jgi:hypothetical protein
MTEALTERQQEQQWVENTRELHQRNSNRALAAALPNLRDVADRARVMGDCFVCAGVVECELPGLCGYDNPEEPRP